LEIVFDLKAFFFFHLIKNALELGWYIMNKITFSTKMKEKLYTGDKGELKLGE
jgi:hypothetical protein